MKKDDEDPSAKSLSDLTLLCFIVLTGAEEAPIILLGKPGASTRSKKMALTEFNGLKLILSRVGSI